MTSHDLKDLLQTMATEGNDRVSPDEHELIPRIRSRRRRRAGLAAAVSASTAVVLAAGAYAVLPNGAQEQPPAATPAPPTVTVSPDRSKTFVCGGAFSAPIIGDPSMRLAAAPQVVTRDAHGVSGPISIQLTNTTGKPLNLFSTPYGPHIVVVKDGVVVALPLGERLPGHQWRFDPGKTVTLTTVMSTRRCTDSDLPGQVELEPGTYQIYAMKNFMQSTDVKLPEVVAAGGPWTIELK